MAFPILVAAMTLGMILGLALPATGIGVAAGVAGVLAFLLGWRGFKGLSASLLVLFAGTAWAVLAQRPPAPATPLGRALAGAVPVTVVGHITTGPDVAIREAGHSGAVIWLDLESLDGEAAAGGLRVAVGRGVPDALPGDRLRFQCRPTVPTGFDNPGTPDARLLGAARGIDARCTVPRVTGVQVVDRGSWAHWRRLAHRARVAMRDQVRAVVDGDAATFIQTAVLGERTASGATVEAGFKAAGATHALSVSGLHLAAVAALFFFLVKSLVGRIAWIALRVNAAAVAAALSIPAVFFYTALTGSAIATCRSALMAAVLFGAQVVARPFSIAASVAFAAVVLLVPSPLWLLDVSFQLSFVSVIALALFAGSLAPDRRQDQQGQLERWRLIALWIWRLIAVSLAAGLLTAPLVAHHFGEITPAAPIGNLVLTPQVELLVVPLGLFGAALALIHPVLGYLPLKLAAWASHLVLMTAEAFRCLAPVWLVSQPGWLATTLLTLALVAALAALTVARRDPRGWRAGRAWCVVAVASALGFFACHWGHSWWRQRQDRVTITFADVGQGDGALIEGPRGFVAVIDGGGLVNSDFDVGLRVMDPLLRRRGISHIDLMILSHPHPDHMQGLFALLERFSVGALWTSGDRGNNPEYDRLLALARKRGVATPQPQRISHHGLVLDPTGPWLGEMIQAAPGLGANDNSLTVRVSYHGRSVLFAGDVEDAGELELVGRAAAPPPLRIALASDVLKVPHHGSRTSSSDELLHAVAPWLAVASTGRQNQFGFPHPEIKQRYQRHEIPLIRTDQCGAITLTLTKSGHIHTTTQKSCR